MQEDGLLAIRRRKFVATTDAGGRMRTYPNLAASLEPEAINQLWVADLTYIRLREQFVFLAVVLDAYSRRVVGWQVGERLTSELAQSALERAIQGRNPRAGLVHHSDGGSQYASGAYIGKLDGIGALASMSRPGRPWENGKCESFIRTLKKEELDVRIYRDREQLEQNIEDFIERYYNGARLHSALGYRSPAQFERDVCAQAGERSWRPARV
jgi:transposase InsO family protein